MFSIFCLPLCVCVYQVVAASSSKQNFDFEQVCVGQLQFSFFKSHEIPLSNSMRVHASLHLFYYVTGVL